ncbi:FxsA family membrane protein [Streptomyces sp. NPDC052051]|uniref:FxsA family membrane protein n=1 Tax=Streptomyces sp. NPDC052051 TaxID=3154649 RepID=UPI003416DABB
MTTGTSTSPRSFRPRRSRLLTLLPLGVAAWLVLEIWLLLLVANAAGGFTVFLLLAIGVVLGAVIVKTAGRRAFQNLGETLRPGRSGAAPSAGGNGLMMLGGVLLMLPGMISDVVGLLLLVPPVQRLVGRTAERTIDRTLRRTPFGSVGGAFQRARMHRHDGKVVQGEVVDDERGTDSTPPGPRPPLGR